jgi:hypothetical protein
MGHFSIHVKGERVGSVLSLSGNQLYVCFNKRYPQYKDTWGTPEQVKHTLRMMIPGAKYEPLDLPKFDKFCAFTDGRISEQEFRPVWNGGS